MNSNPALRIAIALSDIPLCSMGNSRYFLCVVGDVRELCL
jgi:hypothetical protein